MGHGGGTPKKPLLFLWTSGSYREPRLSLGPAERAPAGKRLCRPVGRVGPLRGGRASPSQAPAVPTCNTVLPRYSPLGNGSIFLQESALSPRKRSPGEEREDDAEAQPRLFLLPPQAPRTGAASGSPEPLRPHTPQPVPTDPVPLLPRPGTQAAQPAVPRSAPVPEARTLTSHHSPGPRRPLSPPLAGHAAPPTSHTAVPPSALQAPEGCGRSSLGCSVLRRFPNLGRASK